MTTPEKTPETTPINPPSTLNQATPCSICTFTFMSSLIQLGHRRPLEKKDVPQLPHFDDSTMVDRQYQQAMASILDEQPHVTAPGRVFSAWTAVKIAVRARGVQLFYGGFCLVLWSVCYALQPLYIKAILVEVQLKHLKLVAQEALVHYNLNATTSAAASTSTVYHNASYYLQAETTLQSLNPLAGLPPLYLFFVCILTGLCQVLLLNHAFFHMFRFGFSIRLGFMNKVWEKALRLSSSGKLDPSMGNIQTLMAVDPMRIMGGAIGVHWVWLGPVLIVAAVFLMAIEIGLVSLVAVGILLVIIVIQINIVLKIKQTRRKLVSFTDKRIQLTNEILTGIRMIKSYAWEKHATLMVEEARQQELFHLKWLLYYLAGNAIVFFMAPIVIAVTTFSTYAAIYGSDQLNVPKVVAVLGYMNLMRLPMALTPKMLGAFVDSLVSYKRLGIFLFQGDEVQGRPPFARTTTISSENGGTGSGGTADSSGENIVRIAKGTVFAWSLVAKESTKENNERSNDSNNDDNDNNNDNNDNDDNDNDNNDVEVVADHSDAREAKPTTGTRLHTESEEMFGETKRPPSHQDGNQDDGKNSTTKGQAWKLRIDQNADLLIPKGALVVVLGLVGSGKSSLLNAILGEMKECKNNPTHQNSGSTCTIVNGAVALVAQKAWIQNASVKEAILFGSVFDSVKYQAVLKASQLLTDLESLPDGDRTEIGDRGLNLSGGQKQRIAIARALYKKDDKDLFLFDDPLSAVDVHVASALWENVLGNNVEASLHQKTRMVVMNSHYHFIHQADLILYCENGQAVKSYTTAAEAIQDHPWLQSGHNNDVRTKHGNKDNAESSTVAEGVSTTALQILNTADNTTADTTANTTANTTALRQRSTSSTRSSAASFTPATSKEASLYAPENRKKGAVTLHTYLTWFNSAGSCGGGVGLALVVFLFFSMVQIGRTLSDLFLTWWSRDQTSSAYVMYVVVSGCTLLFLVGRSLIFAQVSVSASRNFHRSVFKSVLSAPINLFFDVTHVGEILNRFSGDMDHIDLQLPEFAMQFFQNSLYCLAAMVICAWSSYYFLAMLVPMTFIYVTVQNYFRKTSRELKRIEGTTRSPIFSSYQEMLAGLDTIRAFDVSQRFIQANQTKVNFNTSAYLMFQMASRWLALRLDVLGVTTFCSVAGFALFLPLPEEQLPVVGLALIYALQITGLLQWTVRTFIETENNMTAVERLNHYQTHIPKEKLSKKTVAASWPTTGSITITNLTMRYRPSLPLVLKGVNLQIKSKEKIGIVGRTGSGKSSLIQALFRIVESEWEKGSRILIDGERIDDMPLDVLRNGLSIIPQDPVLFSGTIRRNLDPFELFQDHELWKVLEMVELSTFVQGLNDGLTSPVSDSGENFSAGQRQLMCFARALLRKSNIIVMDEATASVDSSTDEKLQKMIRERFVDQTLICIAHRLDTILDSDRVCVMDDGKVVEYDTPSVLLNDPSSVFSGLVSEMQQRERGV